MINRILCLLFIVFTAPAFSQNVTISLTKAKNDVERGDYYSAINHYLDALKNDSLNKKANLEFGLLNTQYVNNPSRAGLYLLRVERMSTKDTLPELILGLAQYYQSIGEYQKATLYYKRLYAKMEKKPEGAQINAQVTRSLQDCNYALSNPKQPSMYKIFKTINAGNGVNTIYPEYFPILNEKENVILFTTRRRENTGHKIDDFDTKYFEDMYLARKNGGNYTDAHMFSDKDAEVNGLGNSKEHEAVVSLSFDGTALFTFLNDRLYKSVKKDGKWNSRKELNSTINPNDGFQSYLSVSADGKTAYFSSDRPGGLGKLDIYKSELQADGNWGPATNLGPVINTREDDDSPFISYDGKTLFFASKGRDGYGEYDLFRSSLTGPDWGTPVNMGKTFNSSGNDSHLSFNEDESSGIYTSAKAGGYGDMDIYLVLMKGPFEDFVADAEGRINIKMPDTVYVSEPVTMGAFSNNISPSEFKRFYWQMNDSILSADGEIAKHTFGKTGSARIRVVGLTKSKEYIGYEKNVFVMERPAVVTTNSAVASGTTTPTVRSSDNIYFGFDKYIINSEAQTTLLSMIKKLKENPAATVSIAAYCDSRGPDLYNIALSEKRARAAAWFLRSHGLDKKRIKNISWFGEKDPLNKCVDGTPCTAGEYKINRRVEFKVE
ncbi:MAG: OmpA family protein [Bacteroidia bacterium]